MSEPDYKPDAPLSPTEARRASQLSAEQLAAIDRVLLAHASERSRKVSRVVAAAMADPSCQGLDLPDVFFASRIRALVALGTLTAHGDLAFMRYSEVRLAHAAHVDRT